MSSLILNVNLTDSYTEVHCNNNYLLQRYNSEPGINLICINRTLTSAINWNIKNKPPGQLIHFFNKIPMGYFIIISCNKNLKYYLSQNDARFLKMHLKTKIFDNLMEIPDKWYSLFYINKFKKCEVLQENVNENAVNNTFNLTEHNDMITGNYLPLIMKLKTQLEELKEEHAKLKEEYYKSKNGADVDAEVSADVDANVSADVNAEVSADTGADNGADASADANVEGKNKKDEKDEKKVADIKSLAVIKKPKATVRRRYI